MERATLENDLSRAEAHVANGQKRIAKQHEIIAELDREGHDTAPAKDMLASFERTQAMHVANRDRFAGQPSVRRKEKWPARDQIRSQKPSPSGSMTEAKGGECCSSRSAHIFTARKAAGDRGLRTQP
jgi:hypothetical protein